MRKKICAVASVLVGGFFAPLASAQYDGLESPPEPQMNRFAMSFRSGLNIKADFKRLGGFTSSSSPSPATGGHTDRTYDDGYVKVDSTGNDHGFGGVFPEGKNQTWNWGYENASQVPLPGNDVIMFHSSSSAANVSSKNVGDDPQNGFEVIYNRRIRQVCKGWWGIEAAFGFVDVSIGDVDFDLEGT